MRPQVEVCLIGKRTFFGPEIVALLKHIECLGSVREACQKTGISYSKGLSVIHLAEKELGYKVVDCQPGGKNGGKAAVSAKGSGCLSYLKFMKKR